MSLESDTTQFDIAYKYCLNDEISNLYHKIIPLWIVLKTHININPSLADDLIFDCIGASLHLLVPSHIAIEKYDIENSYRLSINSSNSIELFINNELQIQGCAINRITTVQFLESNEIPNILIVHDPLWNQLLINRGVLKFCHQLHGVLYTS